MKIRETGAYRKWFAKLRDAVGKARILVRLRRASLGNFGVTRDLGDNVSEFKFGPGYRICYIQMCYNTDVLNGKEDEVAEKKLKVYCEI